MDGNEDYEFYSSRRQSYQAYLYGSNWEDSDDEQRYESDQGYDNASVQQIYYGGIYDQGEEQRDSYPQIYDCGVYDLGEGYHNPLWGEDDQLYDQEDPCVQYPPSPQEKSSQDDTLMALMVQMLDQQKEANQRLEQIETHQKMLESRLAQQANEILYMVEMEGSSNEEALESFEDQNVEVSLEVLDQAFEEENCDEDLSARDYILSFFSTSPTNDELDPHLEGSLELEQEMPRGLPIKDNLVDDVLKDLRREPPFIQEFIRVDKDIESWTPKHHNEGIESWLFIEPWSGVEDPYLFTLPPSKFLSFRPYMDISIKRNSYDPSVLMEACFLKGSKSVFDVHLKLGGRKYKWDIKIS